MITRAAGLLGTIVVTLAACDATSMIQQPNPVGLPPHMTSISYDTVPAVDTPIEFSTSALSPNCSMEACGEPGGVVTQIIPDASGFQDLAWYQCPGKSELTPWYSHICWDCYEACPASACPSNALCGVRVGVRDSDCRKWTCANGTTPFWHNGERSCAVEVPPSPTVTIDGPSEIYPGTQCTWTAHASGGGGGYTYNWWYDGNLVGSGSSYTGGVLSGDINTDFTLRVVVTDANGKAADAQVHVREDPGALMCAS